MPTLFSKVLTRTAELQRELLWRSITPNFVSDSGVTVRLRSESDWFVFGEIFVRKDYDAALARVFAVAESQKPICILDLGANTGLFALRCLDIAQSLGKPLRLIAVEGCPPTFEILKSNVMPFSNVQVVHGLVGRVCGTARIYASRSLFANRIVGDGEKYSSIPLLNCRALSVPYVNLDAVCPPTVDLVKCDIEGTELEFVKNYERLLRSVTYLVVEFHSRLCDTQSAKDLLAKYGLRRELLLRQDEDVSVELYERHSPERLM